MSTALTICLFVLAALLAIVGIIGAIVPALPGPPISWVALLAAYFAGSGAITTSSLIWMLVFTVVVTILDYVAPAIMTQWGGGSKAATTGATIGTIAGLFFAPAGLLVGPLLGAFLGEWIAQGRTPQPANAPAGHRLGQSLKIAILSFVGFVLTTGMKLVCTLWIAWLIGAAIVAVIR